MEKRFAISLVKICIEGSFLEKLSVISLNSLDNYISNIETHTNWGSLFHYRQDSATLDIMSNVLNFTNSIYFCKRYSSRLYKLFDALLIYLSDGTIDYDRTCRFSYFLQRLIQSGHGFPMATGNFLESVRNRLSQSEIWFDIYKKLFSNVDKIHHELIVFHFITAIDSDLFIKLFPVTPSDENYFLKSIENFLIYNDCYTQPCLAVAISNIIIGDQIISQRVCIKIMDFLKTNSQILRISYTKFLYLLILLSRILTQIETLEIEFSQIFHTEFE
ncbi:hypothetical protein MXB_5511 [Myxobolus squamalis]|nr:hypothetical protein MXB_5511 [Myxobolus squamalis]